MRQKSYHENLQQISFLAFWFLKLLHDILFSRIGENFIVDAQQLNRTERQRLQVNLFP
jgi:hypothetical protein